MEESKLKEIIEQAIAPRLQEQFNIGAVAGWKACANALYKRSTSLTTAKDIHKMLKEEANKDYNIPVLEQNSD